MERLRDKFYILQAELKMKAGRSSWCNDQLPAFKWAEDAFGKMEPHAKEDIKKFQEKLEKIDKELDK